MFIKKCLKCKKEFSYDNSNELHSIFYFKKTNSGNYFLNKCKECVKEERRNKYKNQKSEIVNI